MTACEVLSNEYLLGIVIEKCKCKLIPQFVCKSWNLKCQTYPVQTIVKRKKAMNCIVKASMEDHSAALLSFMVEVLHVDVTQWNMNRVFCKKTPVGFLDTADYCKKVGMRVDKSELSTYYAITSSDATMLRWLHQHEPRSLDQISKYMCEVGRVASLDVACFVRDNLCAWGFKLAYSMMIYGHNVEIFKSFVEEGMMIPKTILGSAFRDGNPINLETVEWLEQRGYELPILEKSLYNYAILKCNYQEVFHWLIARGEEYALEPFGIMCADRYEWLIKNIARIPLKKTVSRGCVEKSLRADIKGALLNAFEMGHVSFVSALFRSEFMSTGDVKWDMDEIFHLVSRENMLEYLKSIGILASREQLIRAIRFEEADLRDDFYIKMLREGATTLFWHAEHGLPDVQVFATEFIQEHIITFYKNIDTPSTWFTSTVRTINK